LRETKLNMHYRKGYESPSLLQKFTILEFHSVSAYVAD